MRPWVLLVLAGGLAAAVGCGDEFTGTTGGGGSGGTGATGGTAGTGGTGGSTGSENCLNGIDDDDNGVADCEDPQCQQLFTCVPPAPPGWTNVGWLTAQVDAPCPGALPTTVDLFDESDLQAPAADCGCSCSDAPTECEVMLQCYNTSDCTPTSEVGQPIAVNQTCSDHDFVNQSEFIASCEATPPIASPGPCEAQANPTTELTWPATWRACMTDQGGHCGSGDWCVRRPTGEEAVGPCLARAGDHECPDTFADKTLYDLGPDSIDDTRSCEGCVCGAPTGGACDCSSCQVLLHQGPGCAGAATSPIPANNVCTDDVDIPAGFFGLELVAAQVTAGSCAPSGGNPTGDVTADGPITVCCLPN